MSKEMSSDKELLEMGKKLRKLRKKKNFSNANDFAWANELNHSQYGKYEAGRANITLKILIKILNIHEMSLEEFFKTWKEDPKKEETVARKKTKRKS